MDYSAFPSIQVGLNPAKYAAEQGRPASQSPVMAATRSQLSLGTFLFVAAILVVLWAAERGKRGLGLRIKV